MPQVGEIQTNPRNPAQKAQWNGSRWVAVPTAGGGAGMRPAPAEWGSGAVVMPNGDVLGPQGPRGGQRPKLGTINPSGEVAPEIKEFQSNAAFRATLMDEGQRKYEEARRRGYDPGRDILPRAVEGIWGVGPFVANVIRDDPAEMGRAAELQFVDGALRTTTGANAPEPEVVRGNKAYFQQPGEAPAVEKDRSVLRKRFRDQSVRIAGPAYIDPYAPGGNPRNPLDLSDGRSRASVPRGAYYRDGQGNVRLNENGDRGNPIIIRAPARPQPARPAPARQSQPTAQGQRKRYNPQTGRIE